MSAEGCSGFECRLCSPWRPEDGSERPSYSCLRALDPVVCSPACLATARSSRNWIIAALPDVLQPGARAALARCSFGSSSAALSSHLRVRESTHGDCRGPFSPAAFLQSRLGCARSVGFSSSLAGVAGSHAGTKSRTPSRPGPSCASSWKAKNRRPRSVHHLCRQACCCMSKARPRCRPFEDCRPTLRCCCSSCRRTARPLAAALIHLR